MPTNSIFNSLVPIKENTKLKTTAYQPIVLNLSNKNDCDYFTELIKRNQNIQVFDTIETQVKELIKCQNPSIILQDPSILEQVVNDTIHKQKKPEEYGVWIYYPWSDKIVHLLNKEDFITVRTNRNKYKITEQEQQILASKKIGVMGLSVGQSVSLTLAMERGFGELRIADFDTLDLSNLNRIRSGIYNIGIPKTTLVAREIAEIDPFLKVTCYHDGITEENIHDFLTKDGKLDLLIDECDSFDVKINARKIAKSLQIPVLMEGSDRCTIDIERFDLEPQRPVLHGLVEHLDMDNFKNLKTFDEKIPYISAVTGAETLSYRMKASAIELMSTISTWPQLASAVIYGGGVSADLSRKILLNQLSISGRYFLDLDEIFSDEKEENKEKLNDLVKEEKLNQSMISEFIQSHQTALSLEGNNEHLDTDTLLYLIEAAKLAPSGGNNQPWHWHYKENQLHLFMDENETLAYLDPDYISSYQSMGAAIENLLLAAAKKGLKTKWKLTPEFAPLHLAVFSFQSGYQANEEELLLEKQIPLRHTNRKSPERTLLPKTDEIFLKNLVERTEGVKLTFIDDLEQITTLAEIATETDLLRMFIPEAHEDFTTREMRWTPEQASKTENGIGIHTLDLSNNDNIGIRLLRDRKMIDFLKEIKGGSGFGKLLKNQFLSASALGLISIPNYSVTHLINCGIASERMWLTANQLGYQIHPLNVPLLFFYKNSIQKNLPLDIGSINKLIKAEHTLNKIFKNEDIPLFMFRIFKSSSSPERTIRKSNHKIFSIGNTN